MARGYLNSLSFPAASMDAALALLSELRAGIALMVQRQVLDKTVMCSWRIDALPLTADYETLRDAIKRDGGGFRDTILFFLQLFDQRSPVTAALTADDRAAASPHVVDGLGTDPDETTSAAFVACALDEGVMLSIGSAARWEESEIVFSLLTAQEEDPRHVMVANICGPATAAGHVARLEQERDAFVFDNWAALTGNAHKSPQLDAWFAECRRLPGLEAAIMRSLNRAFQAGYVTDGLLMKRLTNVEPALLEIRIYRSGPIRILFTRDNEGRAVYGYGGAKTGGNTWYDHAVPQAQEQIARLLR